MPLTFERLSFLSRRVYENFKTYNRKLFASVPIALLLMIPSPDTSVKIAVPKNSIEISRVNLVLSTTSSQPVMSATKISIIVPGESVYGREQRLAAEAAAKIAAAKKAAQVQKDVSVSTVADPANLDVVYQAAGNASGVDWRLIKAINFIETGAVGSTAKKNPSGASGPFQFLPSTFRSHSVDGNGDGVKDITNIWDSAFSAAHYLRACGYPDMKKALWGYNPSTRYYTKVLNLARSLGFQG
ncbi:MAG: lytic transglycosylase domain-containing protein [bacterium]|nr:lytic transglycosylase domain-containing protein [bacterium]